MLQFVDPTTVNFVVHDSRKTLPDLPGFTNENRQIYIGPRKMVALHNAAKCCRRSCSRVFSASDSVSSSLCGVSQFGLMLAAKAAAHATPHPTKLKDEDCLATVSVCVFV